MYEPIYFPIWQLYLYLYCISIDNTLTLTPSILINRNFLDRIFFLEMQCCHKTLDRPHSSLWFHVNILPWSVLCSCYHLTVELNIIEPHTWQLAPLFFILNAWHISNDLLLTAPRCFWPFICLHPMYYSIIFLHTLTIERSLSSLARRPHRPFSGLGFKHLPR